jgi:cysteine desulfurase / selenocysteine lyase
VFRDDFPLLQRRIDGRQIVYFDSAATSLNPRPVLDAAYQYAATIGANVHRGRHTLAAEASAVFESARQSIARFICAEPECVIFVRGATEGLNQVATGLELSKDDNVLVPVTEHHSNLLPWMRVANVVPLATPAEAAMDIAHVADALEHSEARVFAFSHASNVTGVVQPAAALCRAARDRGVISVVDASQSAPHLPIDVRALECDFITFSGHKMLGPFGIGVLSGRREALDKLRPMMVGGGTVDHVDQESFILTALPARLEAGTPNILGAVGLAAAVAYLDQIGWDELQAHEACLADRLRGELSGIPRVRMLMARSKPCLALASFVFEGAALKPGELATMLSLHHNIMVRSGRFCAEPLLHRVGLSEGAVRVSAYLYNTEDEIGLLGSVLRDFGRRFTIRG